VSVDLDARQQAMLREMGIHLPLRAPQTSETAQTPRTAPTTTVARTPDTAPPISARPAVLPGVVAQAPAGPPSRAIAPGGSSAAASLDWAALQQAVAGCRACPLYERRTRTVFGAGPAGLSDGQAPLVDWMVIGEAPGEQEDLSGEPFVGPAGKLLDNMLRALGLDRRSVAGGGVYIANTVKCRPPGNRNPEPGELAQCAPFLERQVALVRPRIILAMGRFAVQSLLQSTEPLGKLRGRVHHWRSIPVVVTYHPAYLLRNLPDKAKAWADLCLAAQTLAQAPGRRADATPSDAN
jgi:uracil-DNA glycosylase family 4